MSNKLCKTLAVGAAFALLLVLFSVSAFANTDPVQAVNNLSDFGASVSSG